MKKLFVFFILAISILSFSQNRLERNLVGHWTFDDPENLALSSTGNNLELVGTHLAVEGPETGDGAVNIGIGSYYE